MSNVPANTPTPPSVRRGEQRSGRPSLLLWSGLAALLACSFLLDRPAADAFATVRHSQLAELLQDTVRWLGTGYVQVAALLVLVAVSALFHLPTLRAGAWALLGFLLSGAAALVLKVLIHRPRPWVEGSPQGWSDYLSNSSFHSFPSGESTTSFALAVVLGAWFPKLRLPLMIAAAVVAAARVLVRSHFPSDVMAGAVLGIFAGQLVNRLSRRCACGAQEPIPRQRGDRA